MTRTRARSCDGKRRHDTKAAAEDQLWALRRAGTARGSMGAYRCRHCDSWHVGHKPRKR